MLGDVETKKALILVFLFILSRVVFGGESVFLPKEKIRHTAERAGFEPAIPVKVCTLSKRVPSTTRPPFRSMANFSCHSFCDNYSLVP